MKFLLREISQGRSNVYLITVCKIQFPHKSLISTLDVGTCDCKITKAHADVVWKPMTRYELHFTVLLEMVLMAFLRSQRRMWQHGLSLMQYVCYLSHDCRGNHQKMLDTSLQSTSIPP